ncbi:hypothetical protein FRB94_005550 [Tulasnella sp. JGI-2019a]|nr:hypothetical protein FRB93_006033 [Tulasnella sp. JGI-2019a]KAG9012614.1 hypothetical protein FRB94_005550 [Tulasnella sp. JGI-2019a]
MPPAATALSRGMVAFPLGTTVDLSTVMADETSFLIFAESDDRLCPLRGGSTVPSSFGRMKTIVVVAVEPIKGYGGTNPAASGDVWLLLQGLQKNFKIRP